ncbi:MAG: glycoside hydrolase family 15 protein [Terriglobales bacterium]
MHQSKVKARAQVSESTPETERLTKAHSSAQTWPKIGDYGIIGDCRAAALVSRDGSIEWLCWPRFDKPSIFAALLDREKGGQWRISPAAPATITRRYAPDSNVLETRFSTPSGSAVLTDVMTSGVNRFHLKELLPDHEIIRKVSCLAGEMQLEIELSPRARYGKSEVKIREIGKLGFRFAVDGGVYWLRSSIPLAIDDQHGTANASIILHAGESLHFSFSYSEEAPAVLPPLDKLDARIDRSIDAWQQWGRRAKYDGEYRDAVVRSALALKVLSYSPSGAIVAAPTTSLPERIGEGLNWDYRYCWLRDASFTVRALLELGYWDEAEDFLDWMLQATRLTQPELRILYTLHGHIAPVERELDYLTGYQGSCPVRIGNGARNQLQLDVYGEVIDAAAQFAFRGGHLDGEMQKALIGFGNYVVKNWDQPDEGIWEPRSGRQNHTHSRLLCWTALDRLVRLAERGILRGAPVERYKQNSESIRHQIEERAWNERLQSYVSVLDGERLDSSLLLLSWYGFAEAKSPRMQSTYRAIRKELGTTGGLLYRYRKENPEGAFAMCSFWEAEYLALGGGSLDEAQSLFTSLLKYANDLGLYSEEIDPDTGAALGNFPQAFTHVGLIGAALSIDQRANGERQLAHRPPAATRHMTARPATSKPQTTEKNT